MKLYHGSGLIVEEPNIEILNYRTDFGKGFYTTTDLEQAKRWVIIKKNRSMNLIKDLYINTYEYNENNNLKILDFNEATGEWLDFVFENRFSDKLLHKYDIVKGPVADDNLYETLLVYQKGLANKEFTIERLKTYKLSNQISFHTIESLKHLKFLNIIKVEEI